MKKSILTAAVAMALGLSSANVLAVVNIDTNVGAATYASEVDAENLAAITGTGLDSTVALGFGFSLSNSIAYVRYDIEGGTWSAAIAATDLNVNGQGNGVGVALSAGGTTADSSVVFNITAPAAGLAPTATVNFVLGTALKGIKLSTNASGVTLRYRLYANPVDAATGNANTLKDASASLIAFGQGLNFTSTTNTSTASVATAIPFTEFLDRVAPQPVDANTARIGAVTLGVNPGILDATGAVLAAPGTILAGATATAAGTNIVVAGDFTGVNATTTPTTGRVYLASDTGCATAIAGGTGVLAADQQSATFGLPLAAGTTYVCYEGDGATGFAEDTYTVSMVPVTQANYLATKVNFNNLALGEVKRDGTELQATFMSNASAQVSRFIFINTGSSPAPLTAARVYLNDGTTYTPGNLVLPVNIPAGGRLAIQASQVVGGFSTGSNAGVVFSIGATDTNIQGTYQYKMVGAEVQTVVQMVRPGTN